MVQKTSIGELIVDTIDLRREYDERQSRYKRMIELVSLILNSAIERHNVKIHSLKFRLKNYESFLEKVERKRYQDPFSECTDLAGCRIVCLFQSQVEKLQKIIKDEFHVLEMTDKITAKKFDQFGYLSVHMLIKMPKDRLKFTECSGLDNLICEIQIRTILQEAWAEIEHYLNYKATKEERNEQLLRKIFSLAGMFEVADSTFEEINNGFKKMVEKKPEPQRGITALLLYKFSKDYFKWYENDWTKKEERSFYKLSQEVKKINIKSIAEIKLILEKFKSELDQYEIYHKRKENRRSRFFTPVGLIRAALALEFGKKFDLVFGLRGYSDKVRKEAR